MARFPASMLTTAVRAMPTASAAASWVSPQLVRASLSLLPMVVWSMPISSLRLVLAVVRGGPSCAPHTRCGSDEQATNLPRQLTENIVTQGLESIQGPQTGQPFRLCGTDIPVKPFPICLLDEHRYCRLTEYGSQNAGLESRLCPVFAQSR